MIIISGIVRRGASDQLFPNDGGKEDKRSRPDDPVHEVQHEQVAGGAVNELHSTQSVPRGSAAVRPWAGGASEDGTAPALPNGSRAMVPQAAPVRDRRCGPPEPYT